MLNSGTNGLKLCVPSKPIFRNVMVIGGGEIVRVEPS